MQTTWRLVITSPARGAWNMAVDEAILEAIGRELVPPTLRLYSWEPPCLSLGYAQPIGDVDLVALLANGWDLVRRPTGGRAILHTDELTYSVIGPHHEPRLQGGVLESYQRLSQALLKALELLNIPAQVQPLASSSASSFPSLSAASVSNELNHPVCFEIPSNYEILAQGRKIIGSAQARRKEGVLQHGSFPLCGDLTRILQVLNFPDENARLAARERLKAHAATAEEVLGEAISWQQAADAMIQGFELALDLRFVKADLTGFEIARAEELYHEKYTSLGWNHRL
ncbi:MAG: lipoate--protein ligase family protein [Anaerolineales bacterium]|nr:lipoate--protein ligase family protein [Anaerolineales bacterium]MDW8446604.1 lipoate--protein ligase family protein [Anaerolineales bacterium]